KGDRRARVLHQGEGRHAEALRGGAVDLAHFRRAHDFHDCDPDGSDPAVCSSSRNCWGSPMAIRKSPASMRSSGAGLKCMPASRLMARMMTPRSWRMRDVSMVLPAHGLRGVTGTSPISRSTPRCVWRGSSKLTTCGRRKEWAILFPSRRQHTRLVSDWSSDVCSSDLEHTSDLQAKDGIRDWSVTGVQTCALRSEERRVGEECRSRWSACHSKKQE